MAHRKGRSLLTASGIVLGVAIFFGVLVTNATTSTGVDRLLEDFTGRADVSVSPTGSFDADLPPGTLARVRALPDVRTAVADYSFPARFESGAERSDVVVDGFDFAALAEIHDVNVARGRVPAAGAREVAIPRKLAAKLGTRTNAVVSAVTARGRMDVTVSGVLEDNGAGRANEGDVAYTTLPAARSMAGLPSDGVNGVSVILREGTDVDAWIDANAAAVGAGVTMRNADTLAAGFRDFLKVLGGFFAFFATITLFVGAFLIYLTLSMAVVERTRVYGTMRALGATRGQVARVVVAEAAVLGTISTVVGLLAGLGIAKGLLVLVANLFDFDLPGLTIRPGAVVSAALVGVVTTLVASLLPAVRAGRLAPVLAMKGNYDAETKLGRGWIAGVVLVAIGFAARIVASSSPGLTSLSVLVLLLGAVLVVPLMLRPLASVLGRVTNKIARGIGDVAVLHLVKERSRSAYTLALIMVVMSMLFSIGGLQRSVTDALDTTLRTQFGADLDVDAQGAVDPGVEGELRKVPGVARVTPMRFAQTDVLRTGKPDKEIFVLVIDPATYFDVSGYQWASGDETAARAGLAGGGVLLPEGTAADFGTRTGDELTVRTASGPKAFTVAATFVSFQGQPVIVMGLNDGRTLLNAVRPSSFQVALAKGVSADKVKRAIERDLGSRYPLEIQTAADLKTEATGELGQYFNIFYAILLVAAVTGLLSLANTLAVSVVRRYREIGILRAIGVTQGQVWRMVLVESATLGLTAFVLSLPLGWLMSSVAVRGTSEAFHFSVPYRYPAGWVPIVAVFGIVVAVVAAIAPGRRAARLEVVGALQYE